MTTTPEDGWFVRAPASSANLGAGFDVFGMALSMYADSGLGEAPRDAQQLDDRHPGRLAFEALGGSGPMWMRCNIPMGRGLGFSGAARVSAAALAVAQAGGSEAIAQRADEILDVTAGLEGHGDNVAASLHGGVTAFVDGACVQIPVGPTLAAAAFVAWVPSVTTSTDASRRALDDRVERSAAVHNIGAVVKFVMAFVNDDPAALAAGVDDRLHQAVRLPQVDGAAAAITAGVGAGAWAGWLSGSGPTVGLLCDSEVATVVAASLHGEAHTKILSIDTQGCRVSR